MLKNLLRVIDADRRSLHLGMAHDAVYIVTVIYGWLENQHLLPGIFSPADSAY